MNYDATIGRNNQHSTVLHHFSFLLFFSICCCFCNMDKTVSKGKYISFYGSHSQHDSVWIETITFSIPCHQTNKWTHSTYEQNHHQNNVHRKLIIILQLSGLIMTVAVPIDERFYISIRWSLIQYLNRMNFGFRNNFHS